MSKQFATIPVFASVEEGLAARGVDITTLNTMKTPRITLPVHEQRTEQAPVVTPDVFSVYDWRMIQDFAREDGISPRLFVKRLLTVEYHRRLIGRDVAALERSGAR